ncbi:MFS transporter [Microbacterium sp.]|uniref:MFS transporter n=1 Tax=Microbacterium sp. TaxID=51671 RepID=UPI0037352039
MWRLPTAWALAITFFVSSSIAYTCFAWLPTILIDVAGVSARDAGLLLSLFALIGFPASLLMPALVARRGIVMPLFVIAAATGVVGAAGLLFLPTVATWLWVALLGSTPLLFPIVLTLVGLRTRRHQTTVALSAFTQSVGYAITMLMPLGVGLLHDATDSWTAPIVILGAIALLALPTGLVIARRRKIEDEWELRHGAW